MAFQDLLCSSRIASSLAVSYVSAAALEELSVFTMDLDRVHHPVTPEAP